MTTLSKLMILSDEQTTVFDQIEEFLADENPRRMWFALHGLAGTGKSMLLGEVARQRPDATLCAYTGKAASVLSRKTGLVATTIHSAIYTFLGEDERGELVFGDAHEEGAWKGHVALVDESSMLSEDISLDLLRTGCKIVAVGDPGQLPPIQGEQFFRDPDTVLRTVHRQAWDSPIIRQAHAVREGRNYRADGDDFRVERFVLREDILAANAILCWRNTTRSALNRLVRAHKGLDGAPVQAGEPLMCLRNNHKHGVLNGAIYEARADRRPWDDLVLINERGQEIEIPCRIEDLESPSGDKSVTPFAFGYCATVHKFQGSEANRVILVDEYDRSEERARWLYTGITRAKKSIIVQRG
jgi:exodeoxyribonuclease V